MVTVLAFSAKEALLEEVGGARHTKEPPNARGATAAKELPLGAWQYDADVVTLTVLGAPCTENERLNGSTAAGAPYMSKKAMAFCVPVAFGANTAGDVAVGAGAWSAAVGEAAAAVPTWGCDCTRYRIKPSSVDSLWRVGGGCKGATAAAARRTTRAAD